MGMPMRWTSSQGAPSPARDGSTLNPVCLLCVNDSLVPAALLVPLLSCSSPAASSLLLSVLLFLWLCLHFQLCSSNFATTFMYSLPVARNAAADWKLPAQQGSQLALSLTARPCSPCWYTGASPG